MNKTKNLNFLLIYKVIEKLYIYLVILSYFFLWDVSYKGLSLKYSIFLIFFFIFIKKISFKKLKLAIYLLIFLIIHLLVNKTIFEMSLTFDNTKGIILMFLSFLFVSVFKEKIFDTLHNLYTYFPIIFVPFTFFTLKNDSLYYKDLNFKCSFFMFSSKNFNQVFLENSHYGMILPSLILYNLYLFSIESRNIYINYTRYLSLFFLVVSSLLYGSTTFNFGLMISIAFLITLYKQYKTFFTISLLLLFTSFLLVFNHKSACSSKISDLSIYFEKVKTHKSYIEKDNNLLNQYDEINKNIVKLNTEKNNLIKNIETNLSNQNIDISIIQKLFISNNLDAIISDLKLINLIDDNSIIENFDQILTLTSDLNELYSIKQNINENIKSNETAIRTNFNVVNVSTQVIIKSVITSFKSFIDNPIGYGVNSYEFAYFKYNPTEVKKAFFGPDTFYINYNDAASNFPKILTEFGILNLLVIFLFILFIFDKNINLKYKILILPLILTMNFRAAGYFNSGYFICIVLVFFLIRDSKYAHTK